MLYENLARLAPWTPSVLWALLILSPLAQWLARRRGLTFAASAAKQIFGLSLVGLVVSLLPMAPLFRAAGQLSAVEGARFPDFEFTPVGGASARHLSDLSGKVVLINFWATWCGPCREELPALNRLQQQHAGRGLVVLTLSDQPAAEIAGYIQKIAPDTLNGTVPTYGWLAVRDFRPWTVVIDRQGILRDYAFGQQDFHSLDARVRPLL